MAVKKKTKAIILAAFCLLIIAAIALSAVLVYRSTPQFALNEAAKYIDMADYKSAILALEEALIIFPENADIRLALSKAYELDGDIDNALRVLTEYVDMYDVPADKQEAINDRISRLGENIISYSHEYNIEDTAISGTGFDNHDDADAYSSVDTSSELMGEPPASAEEVVNMINDYLQNGTEPDRDALKYVTWLYIAGDRCLAVALSDGAVTSNYLNANPYCDRFDEVTGAGIASETFFELLQVNEDGSAVSVEIVPWGTISDISFIPRYFPNLISLLLSFNKVEDVSPLADMTDLQVLILDHNDIADVSALKEMKNLIDITLDHNKISDDVISELKKAIPECNMSADNNVASSDKSGKSDNISASPVGVEITDYKFPDDIFRAYIKENYDTDNDNYLSPSELSAVRTMDISDLGISDISGIEHFSELYELLFKNSNAEILYLSNMSLKKLDVSGCTSLEYLYCDNNSLSDLYIYNCPMLYFVDCSSNCLTELDISDNKELKWLFCTDNPLSDKDIFAPNLTVYSISYSDISGSATPKKYKIIMTWDGETSMYTELRSDTDILTRGFLDYNYPIKIGYGLVIKDDEGNWIEFTTDEKTKYIQFDKIDEGVYKYSENDKEWEDATALTFDLNDTIELLDLPVSENIFFTQSIPENGTYRTFYMIPVLFNEDFLNGEITLNNSSKGQAALVVVY